MHELLTREMVQAREKLLVLGPHPDDFDAVGITLRHFHAQGRQIDLAVLTSGISGVEDSYCIGDFEKKELRRREQRRSVDFFGLPEQRLRFLELDEDEDSHLTESEVNSGCIRALFDEMRPDCVFLPHPNDTNPDHRRTYRIARRIASQAGWSLEFWLNWDPKTTAMRADILTPFTEEEGIWKGELLRFHDSQQQRNLNNRGHGFDQRILQVNRRISVQFGLGLPYAEAFEIEQFGSGLSQPSRPV